MGAFSSVDLTGHPTASPETRQGLRPLSLPRSKQGQKEKKNTMKAIWILLMILGVLGISMSFIMYGDIGVACFVGALSALLSGIGFFLVGRKLR